ncbi:chitin synthase chs-1-like [Lepisosteus oculatus]|uniref:chitin synthase chs-1-like n=1 Tax=Lepisosteus oculatus TaxID=7918 RepID=UPI0035F52D38
MDDERTKKEEIRQSWDHFREVPDIQDEQKPRKLFRFIHYVICTLIGLTVFALGFFSKSSLLLLITVSSSSSTTISTRAFGLLLLGCTLIVPSILTLAKSLWKIAFKDSKTPSAKTIFWVLASELLVAAGAAILTVVAMPHLDILTNVMILNGVCALPAVLQVASRAVTKDSSRRFIAPPLLAVVLLVAGFVFLLVGYQIEISGQKASRDMYMYAGLAIGGTLIVSLNWWENFSTRFDIRFLRGVIKDIHRSKNFCYVISSTVRILVTVAVVGIYVPLSGQDWASVKKVSRNTVIVTLSLFGIQAISSALCHWFVVVACKLHALRRGFIVPTILTSPAVLLAFVLVFVTRYETALSDSGAGNFSLSLFCQTFRNFTNKGIVAVETLTKDVTQSMCSRNAIVQVDKVGLSLLAASEFSWFVGLLLSTVHVWVTPIQRIERTSELFVRRLYEAAFIDQSQLLNMRFEILKKHSSHGVHKDPVKVYLCATMWHETYDEMMKILISMFRLDRHRPKKHRKTDMSIEAHIFFDDAFKEIEDAQGVKKHCVNEYAETLVEVIKEVYLVFSDETHNIFNGAKPLSGAGEQKIIQTPYGGRLCYKLPRGNLLVVHFKDKQLIRHKKRWSQIMYLYYLLGWKLDRKYFEKQENGEDEKTLQEQLKKERHNTYILALDGDTDFQPAAVMLLVDRLRLYADVGAACGRIHPTGTGPMVWYQKFEYAVGHWLQKTAEHVFGSVLCSPGCFSLFRGAALMDDNVMKRYTTKATEASHYVQYDQGEDRWLCTLLLQQGWRVEYNAASDAYTNAPQEFKEFYNQRRRWGPSTLANTIDLLGSGSLTAQKNKSISRLYIVYQVFTMISTILGPATVCLMIAGSFSFVFNINPNVALALAIVPPAIYLLLCFRLKSDTQISIAAFLSVIYAFLMTATVLSIIGEMVKQQTFVTPSGLFFISLVILNLVTAALHPQEFPLLIHGLLYFISIPSGYLLLTIYSIVNMDNVSWGTRETGSQAKAGPRRGPQKHVAFEKTCKCLCWNIEIQVNRDEKVAAAPELQLQAQEDRAGSGTSPSELHNPSEEDSTPEDIWMTQLQEKSDDLELKEDTLDDDEVLFWEDLIERYLKPLSEDKAKQAQIKKDLKSLRNKVTFTFFIINCLWVVATFFLQAIGSPVSIKIPKIYSNGSIAKDQNIFIDPIGLMFLLSFAGLLLIQFIAMGYHRYVCYLFHKSLSILLFFNILFLCISFPWCEHTVRFLCCSPLNVGLPV